MTELNSITVPQSPSPLDPSAVYEPEREASGWRSRLGS